VSSRLLAVLGYSARHPHGLHAVCEARLREAERLAVPGDTVLLSGWARRDGAGEAELMREAWAGPDVRLIADTTARSTRENAVRVADAARAVGADEVVVVTSQWHAFRARTLVRAALRGKPGVRVRTSAPPGRPPAALLIREIACIAALPLQLLALRVLREPRRPWGSRSGPAPPGHG
jgi:uncharacterized SAM-binding protein YcdF (DUF218 family)